MTMIRPLLPLLLVASLGIGENPPEPPKNPPEAEREVRVELMGKVPEEGAALGYGSPRPLLVETTVPRFLVEIPRFEAKDPVWFRVALGETKGIPFYAALDKSPGSTLWDLLHLDRDRDLDLTNDGAPVRGNVRTVYSNGAKLVEFLDLRLTLPYSVDGVDAVEPYSCVLYYITEGDARPKTVQVERDGWREGSVSLGGTAHVVAVVDDDSDGQFTTGDAWIVRPETVAKGDLLSGDSIRAMVFPSWSQDQKTTVEVKAIDPAGRSVTLLVRGARESEGEFFTKVARARQTPEEQQLKLDPLRPKAGDGQEIDWLAGRTIQYALDIAASPTVNKRLVLDFAAPDCVWCDRMNRFTYRDREVVQLARRFVFAKIAFQRGSAEAAKYGVDGTPTLILLENDGTEVARLAGFQRPGEMAAWLKSALR